jgi:hypothetical protein
MLMLSSCAAVGSLRLFTLHLRSAPVLQCSILPLPPSRRPLPGDPGGHHRKTCRRAHRKRPLFSPWLVWRAPANQPPRSYRPSDQRCWQGRGSRCDWRTPLRSQPRCDVARARSFRRRIEGFCTPPWKPPKRTCAPSSARQPVGRPCCRHTCRHRRPILCSWPMAARPPTGPQNR